MLREITLGPISRMDWSGEKLESGQTNIICPKIASNTLVEDIWRYSNKLEGNMISLHEANHLK